MLCSVLLIYGLMYLSDKFPAVLAKSSPLMQEAAIQEILANSHWTPAGAGLTG